MKIPVAWIDVQPGDVVIVKGFRSPQTVIEFGTRVVFDQDNHPSREAIVDLRSQTGRQTWAWVRDIRSKETK